MSDTIHICGIRDGESDWDGMLGWFMDYMEKNDKLLEDSFLYRWHRAAVKSLRDT